MRIRTGQGGRGCALEDSPVPPPGGRHRCRTHLRGLLLLPAVPVQEEEEEEDDEGCERSREGALRGASHSTGPAR